MYTLSFARRAARPRSTAAPAGVVVMSVVRPARGITSLGAALALLALTTTGGCAKVSGNNASGTGGTSVGPGSGGTSGGGTGSTSGSGGTIGGNNDGGLVTGMDARICQMASYTFEPKIPTVFMLVDQSGSMFKCRTNGGSMDATGRECANKADTSWYPLRDGVLQVVQQLQAEVRFGFAAFTGEQGQAMCPTLSPVLPAQNNYDAISGNYNGLMAPMKGETPTRKAMEQIATLLKADTAPGEKFILFVTDGQPDYCDDGNDLCPPDSVVGELQTLYTDGIKTLVFGISSPLTTISDSVLQAFANAGGGQSVLPPFPSNQTLDLNAFHDQCNGVAGWKADFLATGKPDVRNDTGVPPWPTIGDYGTTSGTATVFKPDLTNQQALVNEISRALAGVKSCVFDLGNIDGKSLKVDLTQLDKAHVLIEGTDIPHADADGWRMNDATQLELVGSACDKWRNPDSKNIDFQFPCEIVIVE